MRARILRLSVIALLVMAVSVGAGQFFAKKPVPPPTCPPPACGWFCPTYYAPVACSDGGMHCIYSNMCFAMCAGWQPGQCNEIGPGPIPVPM